MHFLTLEEAAAALNEGLPVVLPTDTVLGIGVAVDAATSPQALFKAKGRPANKPVAWLVESPDALDAYGTEVPPCAYALARAFWPGALTLVVNASAAVPVAFQSHAGTIGLRMPASDDALTLIRAVGAPLAVTSANPSGAPAPAAFAGLDESLAAATAGVFAPSTSSASVHPDVPCISDEDARPSTVVDCTGGELRVLREGALSWEELKGALL